MPVLIGEPAPDIDLADDDGNRWRVSDQHGRPAVLTFHRHLP